MTEENASAQEASVKDPKEEKREKRRAYRREMRLAKAKRGGRIITIRFIVFALIVGLAVFAYLYVDGRLDKWFPSNSTSGLSPSGMFGYTTIDLQESVLTNTRGMNELVVLEQDVSVDTTITRALANLAIFQKTKVVHSYGTGVYTVDLSALDEDSINISRVKKTITISVPHAVLKYINIDIDATTFEETERALLGFGDIKMTQEQQKELNSTIESSMRTELTKDECYSAADENAVDVIKQTLLPYINSVSGEYTFIIEMTNSEEPKSEGSQQ